MNGWVRLLLYVTGPLLIVLVAGWFYVSRLGHVSTEDSYVKADMVNIAPDVSGRIVAVPVEENQRVESGDVLFRIDADRYRALLVRAKAQLASVREDLEADKMEYRQKVEELALARENVAYAKRELDRVVALHERHALSEADLDDARHTLTVARLRVNVLERERDGILTRLAGNPDLPPEQHPEYIEAAAARDVAADMVARCEVRAPFAGVASRTPEIGQYATAGAPVMSVVSDRQLWIEANFKETDLTHVRPGQSATVEVDAYPDLVFEGVVESISQATGAEFSVLPPQNATGNWVKVVQRIPLRITLTSDFPDTPLRAGMSADVDIDTDSGGTLQQARADDRHAR